MTTAPAYTPDNPDVEELPLHWHLGDPTLTDFTDIDGVVTERWMVCRYDGEGNDLSWHLVETEVCVDGCGKEFPEGSIDQSYLSVRCPGCRKLADDAQETYGRLLAAVAAEDGCTCGDECGPRYCPICGPQDDDWLQA